MNLTDVLRELIDCLSMQGDCVIGWEQTREWPKGAIDFFQKAGWLKTTHSANTVECPGCEENCFMPVQYSPKPPGHIVAPFVACETRSDMGRVKIPREFLQQWQFTPLQIAKWISNELGLKTKLEKDAESDSFMLGIIQGAQRQAELQLDLNKPASLKASGHLLPLIEIAYIADGRPRIEREKIVAMVGLPPVRVTKAKPIVKGRVSPIGTGKGMDIGTPEWRTQTARKAADARHDQPGGSRDKQQQIREIWATGKYTSRDRCAEEECAALNMSFSAARKALRNAPEP